MRLSGYLGEQGRWFEARGCGRRLRDYMDGIGGFLQAAKAAGCSAAVTAAKSSGADGN
jgi:hypothetical protein